MSTKRKAGNAVAAVVILSAAFSACDTAGDNAVAAPVVRSPEARRPTPSILTQIAWTHTRVPSMSRGSSPGRCSTHWFRLTPISLYETYFPLSESGC